jgi:hypothetical protein
MKQLTKKTNFISKADKFNKSLIKNHVKVVDNLKRISYFNLDIEISLNGTKNINYYLKF